MEILKNIIRILIILFISITVISILCIGCIYFEVYDIVMYIIGVIWGFMMCPIADKIWDYGR